MFRASVVDDRCVEHPLVLSSNLPHGSDVALKRLLKRAHAGTWRHLLFLGLGALIGVVGARLLRLAITGGPINVGGSLALMLFMGVGIALGGLSRLLAGPMYRRNARAACLEHELCASCGYSLRGVPVSDNGLRVCPECAAAWALPFDTKL
jgi:hypothetical protein